MLDGTRRVWERQDRHPGDRQRLFTAVAGAIDAERVLYPGSWVDVAPSFVWPDVVYVDADRTASRFFDDAAGVDELIAEHRVGSAGSTTWRFAAQDYTEPLDLEPESFDLLVSLYAGFVSEHCTGFLRLGGHLLVNPSHGDAAMASIDDRYELTAVVTSRSGHYRVSRSSLDHHLVPKRDIEITVESLHASGRGVAYTRSPFAYLFERV